MSCHRIPVVVGIMSLPYVHKIDPIMGSIFGIHLWWYGFSYTLGFLNVYFFVKRRAKKIGLSDSSVYDLSLLLASGVLIGGRLIEVAFYEWPFYRTHLPLIAAYWIGGMATHGLLLGGLLGIAIFSWFYRKPFFILTDTLAIPAAFILGVGRIGNFIDGQIVGSVTGVWWAVKFPDAEGFRHPVVLYDGAKNLLIIPVLMYLGKKRLPPGTLTGVFLFLYSFLRIFVDLFREYPTTLLGLATGQALNILVAIFGSVLIFVNLRERKSRMEAGRSGVEGVQGDSTCGGMVWRRALFCGILLFSLVLPSDWTQDIPARYGKRHAGLRYSLLYPRINPAPDTKPLVVHPSQAPFGAVQVHE